MTAAQSMARQRTPHTSNHRHRPSSARPPPSPLPLLLPLLFCLSLLLPRYCLASFSSSTVVATWVHLPIDPSTAPADGFCDHWVDVDAAHSRLIMVGGDDGTGTGPVGTWALDYSASFTSPTWRNLTIDTSTSPAAIDSPYVGGGPQGGLLSSLTTLSRTFTAGQPELIVWGGHSLVDADFFNAAYESTLSANDTATWVDDSGSTVDMPQVAWATTAWGDVEQTMLFMYGGTGNTHDTT